MKTNKSILIACFLFFVSAFSEGATLLQGVPAYAWYHGCEPTSEGMIMGYWDLHGYPNLFNATGNSVYLTSSVQDEISSPAHNAAYDGTDTGATVPLTSIADWLGTSKDPLSFGSSSATNAGAAIVGYTAFKGYTFQTSNKSYSSTWATIVNEVNAGRPILVFVDSDGNGVFDHAIPVFGYDENRNGDGAYYACYNTGGEDETPIWYKFQSYVGGGKPYGVYGSIQIIPESAPVPEPETTTLALVASTTILLCRRRQNF